MTLGVVALFALRRLDDFDTWWHLAAGRWIARNRAVPSTDVLSFTVPDHEWINLQWLYDLLLYGLWGLGGADLLVFSSAACFVATFWLLDRHLRLYAGPVLSAALLLWVAATVNERFVVRPEMASFPMLAAVQLVLARGRREPGLLWTLVPLMLLWANLHSLFILGIAAIGCALAGSVVAGMPGLPRAWKEDSGWEPPARRALWKWGSLSVVATLANPYFVRALLFPLELMTRIDGSSAVYQVIGEFRPPFSGYFQTFAIGSYQVLVFTFVGLALLAGLLRATERPRARRSPPDDREGGAGAFDLGALAFAAALAWLSLLARRNVGIFAIGALPFVGAAAAVVVARLPKSWTAAAALPLRLAAVLVVAAGLGMGGLAVTNQWYASTGETHEFGLGTFESNFQERAVEFYREQGLPGPLYNDLTAGGYLSWANPTGHGVYIDGRLEVYDTPFFSQYLGNMRNLAAWRQDAAARGIRGAMIFHRWGNRHALIQALRSLPEWKLVYFDETVATFVRADGAEAVIAAAREAFAGRWRPAIEKNLAGPWAAASWQWNIDLYTSQLAYARLLMGLGEQANALHWLEAAIATGLSGDFDVEARQQAAGQHARAGHFAQARLHLERAAEVRPGDPRTEGMLRRLDELSR